MDSSVLLKLFWREPESEAAIDALGREARVVISTLTELEVLVQLKAAYLAGEYTRSNWRRLEARFSTLRNLALYEFRPLPSTLLGSALRQHRNSGNLHCRSLDRSHLAAMEELDLSRLMTNDEAQAAGALALGFEVLRPGGQGRIR